MRAGGGARRNQGALLLLERRFSEGVKGVSLLFQRAIFQAEGGRGTLLPRCFIQFVDNQENELPCGGNFVVFCYTKFSVLSRVADVMSKCVVFCVFLWEATYNRTAVVFSVFTRPPLGL